VAGASGVILVCRSVLQYVAGCCIALQ